MDVTFARAQNWCLDPYGCHEARWFSHGIATALVRDRGVESQDPPPDTSFADTFEMVGPALRPVRPCADRTPRPGLRLRGRRAG